MITQMLQVMNEVLTQPRFNKTDWLVSHQRGDQWAMGLQQEPPLLNEKVNRQLENTQWAVFLGSPILDIKGGDPERMV